jgi:hypothetical protein
MSSNPRRRKPPSGTTADVTPKLAAAVLGMSAGASLDRHLGQSLERLGAPTPVEGLSTTWEGAGRLVARLTALGYYVEMQVHADRCLCRVLHVLKGNALAKQLASAAAPTVPEAVAKAALLTFLEAQPPGG